MEAVLIGLLCVAVLVIWWLAKTRTTTVIEWRDED